MKVLLGHEIILDYFKNDKDFLGGVYVDMPSKDFNIHIENIPEKVDTIYINTCSSFCMAYFWQNYNHIKHLKIRFIEYYNDKYYVYDYKLDKVLNFKLFENLTKKNIEDIYLIGDKNETSFVYDFLSSYYNVNIVKKKQHNKININCTNIYIPNAINKYILNGNIINIIYTLSEEIKIKIKDILDCIFSNYEQALYNPYALLAYIYETHLPKKHKHSIAFYAQTCAYRNNLITSYLLDKLHKSYNIFLFYGTRCNDYFEKMENSFFVPDSLASYFENIDIIVHPQLDIVLPNNPKKFYLLHDIYDSPTGKAEKPFEDKNGNLQISKFLQKVDYIFIPINTIYEKKRIDGTSDCKITCFIPGGYLKLDTNIKKFNVLSKKLKIDSIIYAPTVMNDTFFKYNSQPQYGEFIINSLLKFKYIVIFRPHPHSLEDEYTVKLVKKFKHNKNFIFDNNPTEYMHSYTRSILMVTDFSGTAYTYAFTTNRPVIFFSHNEKELIENLGENITFFEDRKKIGEVANTKNLVLKIDNILNNYKEYQEKIKYFKKHKIFNIGQSEKYFIECIDSIIKNKKKTEWKCIKGRTWQW